MKITKIKNIIKEKPNNIIKSKSKKIVQSYLIAIDDKNEKKIKQLANKNNGKKIKNDIVYEMYNEYQLSKERLLFIIENCTSYLNISSRLITTLIKDNNKNLLEIIFKKHLKFFDNEMIIKLLSCYKNRISISTVDL